MNQKMPTRIFKHRTLFMPTLAERSLSHCRLSLASTFTQQTSDTTSHITRYNKYQINIADAFTKTCMNDEK